MLDGIRKLFGWPARRLAEAREKSRQRKAWDETFRLERAGRFEEAAAVYRALAATYRTENELIFSSESQNAIEMWLRAGKVDEAVADARAVLSLFSETGWLSGTDDGIDELREIAGKFFVAGRDAEANAFLAEVSTQLARFGRTLGGGGARPVGGDETECPHCGAALETVVKEGIRQCAFCGGVIG